MKHLLWIAFSAAAVAQAATLGIEVSVDFSKPVRAWDGFGVNYVEAAQTRDYKTDPQEYGGFSLLPEPERQRIIDLIFGPDGLQPGLLKMFLDPFHEPENDNDNPNVIDMSKFDHETTTKWLRYFAREGLKKTHERGGDLSIITTLYGPPAWATVQKFVRGRDLDPAYKKEVAEYMISWVKYLREQEKLPVKFLSLHNEGEDWVRWPADGSTWDKLSHDYNMYWRPELVAEFIAFMRPMLDKQGLKDVGVTPGENTNWLRFAEWGYAQAIADNPEAMRNLGLITSHGFVSFTKSRWFGDWRATGNEILRAQNPKLHSWVTSQSWGKMDIDFINTIRGNIYATGVNGIIPWAVIQRPAKWVGGDPNPGKAIGVDENGKWAIEPGYYYYKQVSRAGQPGMSVVHVVSNDTEVGLIGFARGTTKHPDAFLVLNLSAQPKPITAKVKGTPAKQWQAFRTGPTEKYVDIGMISAADASFSYTAPPGSVTTFYAK